MRGSLFWSVSMRIGGGRREEEEAGETASLVCDDKENLNLEYNESRRFAEFPTFWRTMKLHIFDSV